MIEIGGLLGRFSIGAIEKELVQNPFMGYDVGYHFDAHTQIERLRTKELESVKKYEGKLSFIFTLYLKTTFKAKGFIWHKGKFVECFDDIFLMEGKYRLRNEGNGNVEGLPSVFSNFTLANESKVVIDKNLQDFNVEDFLL